MTNQHTDAEGCERSDPEAVSESSREPLNPTRGDVERLIEESAQIIDPEAFDGETDPIGDFADDMAERRLVALSRAKAIHALHADALQALTGEGKKDLESARESTDRLRGAPEESVAGIYKALPLTRPITMQDVRLAAGEGKLSAATVLAACNAELQRRLALKGEI